MVTGKKRQHTHRMAASLVAIATLIGFCACQTDSYDTGQGPYSLMQADFVEAKTAAAGTVVSVETDGGHTYKLAQPITKTWAKTPDSTYRALLYYEKTGDSVANAKSLTQVPTLHPAPLAADEQMHTDPVKFESMWISSNRKYLNLGLYLKNGGSANDSLRHTVGMVRERMETNANGKRTVFLRLFHNQGGVPQYYSTRYYVSVPCKEIDADSVVVTVGTYDGIVERRLSLSD